MPVSGDGRRLACLDELEGGVIEQTPSSPRVLARDRGATNPGCWAVPASRVRVRLRGQRAAARQRLQGRQARQDRHGALVAAWTGSGRHAAILI
ncbi:hypothetical protein VFPFJ_09266 [Purpureocillium lilacinum]|uniref:Uncharacterized protein n=1 Tax=Purpureocillium lilacinum TaxID=33203 RepID=A0A179GU52_PURLI|nr:hypothetical protein VFPFJ_09266 [Purpureocillium lilacinum]OAQ80813.1 hypothetical protein VFPFJ_09266 [Purpureocillium lilacinum]